MSKSYGMMVGFDAAIAWVEHLECPSGEEDLRARVLARMRYERDQNIPVPVKRYKGRFVSYDCGNCGHIVDVNNKYCPCCGFAIDWRS